MLGIKSEFEVALIRISKMRWTIYKEKELQNLLS